MDEVSTRGRMSTVIIRASTNKTFSLHTFLHFKKRIALDNVRNDIWTPGLEIGPIPVEHTLLGGISPWIWEGWGKVVFVPCVWPQEEDFSWGKEEGPSVLLQHWQTLHSGKTKLRASCRGLPHYMCFSPYFLRKDFLMMKSIGLFSTRLILSVFSEQKERHWNTSVLRETICRE